MIDLLMPDRVKAKEMFPDNPEYLFGDNIKNYYLDLLKTLDEWYGSFGKDSKVDPPGKSPVVHPPSEGSNLPTFESLASRLRVAYQELENSGLALIPLIRNLKDWNDAGQQSINGLISDINSKAATLPTGMGEDQWILTYITQALDIGTEAMRHAATRIANLAGAVPKPDPTLQLPTAELKPPPERTEDTPKGKETSTEEEKQPPGPGQPPWTLQPPPGATQPASSEPGARRSDPTADRLSKAIDRIENQAQQNPPTAQPPAGAMSSPMGGGDMTSQLLPSLMQAANARNMADPYMNQQRPPLDTRRSAPTVQPPPSPQRTVTPPPQPANTTAAPSPSQPVAKATPAANISATQPGNPATAPGHTPNEDGTVRYTYPPPDGRSQTVPLVVAQALDAAYANTDKTDAQQAYEKTRAKWTDSKHIGKNVGPEDCTTGCIAIFENRSAVLVVFGPDEGGTFEAIVNGEKKPFAELAALDGNSEFGEFMGFAQPPGTALPTGLDKNGAITTAAEDPAHTAPVGTPV